MPYKSYSTPNATVNSFAAKYKCDHAYMKKLLKSKGIEITDGRTLGNNSRKLHTP